MRWGDWKISLRSFISLRWQKRIPRLIVHEKYEHSIKWTIRTLTFIALAASVIAFPVWFMALGFALVLFGLQQFFERAVFQYTTIYVQPLPDFTYDPDEWGAMTLA